MSGGRERRINKRIALDLLVQFRLKTMDDFLTEHASNISTGGMFIRTDSPKPLGSMVYLQFQLEQGKTLIEGLGRVVHVNAASSQAPGMGIEFVNLDDASEEVISNIISERCAS